MRFTVKYLISAFQLPILTELDTTRITVQNTSWIKKNDLNYNEPKHQLFTAVANVLSKYSRNYKQGLLLFIDDQKNIAFKCLN